MKENIQDWLDMPLGETHSFTYFDIIRVPGGWVVTNTRLNVLSSVFVPEPKRDTENDIIQRIREQGFIFGSDLNRLREREGLSGYKGPYPEPIECNADFGVATTKL